MFMKYCLAILVVIGLVSSQNIKYSTQFTLNNENLKPVIGVYTEPSSESQYPASKYQFIAASYVKYLEQAGARVIPIFYDSDQATLDDIFSKINGILFPGGAVDLSKGTLFTTNAEYLLNKTIAANRDGDYFPIWGTCLGFQMLNIIVSGYAPDVLTYVQDVDVTHPLAVYDAGRIYAGMTPEMFSAISNFGIYYYNHDWGIIDETYKKYSSLSNFFKITAHSTTNSGITFIASIESKNYPIYGSQFHPEKMFEWKVNSNHSSEAILAQQYMANFFVSEAKKNYHSFSSESEIYDQIIWDYPCLIADQTSSYNQIYILPNSKNNFESNKLHNNQKNIEIDSV